MRNFIVRSLLCSATIWTLAGPGSLLAAGEVSLPDKDSPEVQWWRDSRTNLDDRLGWFRDARFGMFIHWGGYSGLGNEFQCRRVGRARQKCRHEIHRHHGQASRRLRDVA